MSNNRERVQQHRQRLAADRCRQCEKVLRPLKGTKGILGYGYGGHGYFCALRCAWRFAIDAIEDTEGTPGGSLARRPR